MRNFISRAIIRKTTLFIGLICVSATANAAMVRGRLVHMYPNGAWAPVPGLAVTVFNPAVGRSYPAYSGSDGMYYIQNIPPGTYNLEVWVSRDPRVPPMVFTIQVADPYSDIAPIYV